MNPVSIRIGQAAAQVNYAGVTAVGVYQFNIVVPDLPDGDYPVRAGVAGVLHEHRAAFADSTLDPGDCR